MNEFLMTTLSFPTLPLSILLAFIFVYWLLACTGLVDSDADGWIDPDVGDLLEAGGDHTHMAPASLAGLMSKLGLASVPIMVSASLVVIFMWAFTYYIHLFFLGGAAAGIRWTAGLGVLLLTFVLAVLASAAVIKPVRWFLHRFTSSSNEEKEIRGKEGLVISATVDGLGGRVSVDDGGAGLILNARTLSNQSYPRNTPIVVVSKDENTDVYEVVLKEDFYKPQ